MNVIKYSPFEFDDSSIVSGSLLLENALLFDTLQPDELTVEVISNDTGRRKLLTVEEEWYHTVDNRGYVVMTNDIRNFTYGDPVFYYYDGVLKGKFFIRSVERLSVNHFKLSAFSAVGLWASIQHYGGLYSGETAGDIIADLLTGFTYTIDNDVAAVPLYGYLPIASVRDNLQQVLFAIGASLLKDSNGNPTFKFLSNATPLTIGDDRIFIGGKLNYKTPATHVRVVEHIYYASSFDVQVSLFDNTDGSGTANNKLVTFDEPCYDLVPVGLTIESYGVNHAYVTGTGTLSGTKYTHTTNIFTVHTGRTGETNVAEIKNATLVSPANSANVAARVAEYKGTAEEVSCGIVLQTDAVKPSALISFNDPYGDASQGIISTMRVTMSGKSKADCTIVKGYTPSHFGNNFTNVKLITYNQSWTVPSGTEVIRVVLGQGGQAGQNGFSGSPSTSSSWSFDYSTQAGEGGAGGQGGVGGRVFVTDFRNPSGTLTFTIGAGGTAGDGSGAMGNEGGHTTVVYGGGTYSSAEGASPPEGYRDVLSGVTYSLTGVDGVNGANGGEYHLVGGDVTYNGTTWTGGTVGSRLESSRGTYWADGGAGGGAAYGANGNNGGDGHIGTRYATGGTGGYGADALQLPYVANYGSGGCGGCGGGGGGCPGNSYDQDRVNSVGGRAWGSNGHGGAFSLGKNGGQGYALIFY